MISISLLLLLLPLTSALPTANTTSGLIHGFTSYPGIESFLGIPFATPPLGPLRFAPPQPYHPPSANHTLNAFDPPRACFQLNYLQFASDKYASPAESEDCLTLNVVRPARTTHESDSKGLLPVVVWLYGGGFSSGATALQSYDPTRFVAEAGDVLFVSVNYRVNIFGFPHPAADDEGRNAGLLDQRLALRWLRDNIRSFGGDAARLTLLGHSAGSISATWMAYVYASEPIVSAFGMLSGQPGLIPSDDGSVWRGVVSSVGCAGEGEVECMRRMPARRIKQALGKGANLVDISSGISGGAPVADNVTALSPQEVARRGSAGLFARLPLLISHTTHEFDGTLPFSAVEGVNRTLSDSLTLAAQHCPVAAAAGHWVGAGAPVYRYLFDGAFAATKPYEWVRAYHGADTNLLFGNEISTSWEEPGEEVLAAGTYLRAAVAAFVRDPREGLGREFGWPVYSGDGHSLVRLFANDTVSVGFEDPRVYDAPCSMLTD